MHLRQGVMMGLVVPAHAPALTSPVAQRHTVGEPGALLEDAMLAQGLARPLVPVRGQRMLCLP